MSYLGTLRVVRADRQPLCRHTHSDGVRNIQAPPWSGLRGFDQEGKPVHPLDRIIVRTVPLLTAHWHVITAFGTCQRIQREEDVEGRGGPRIALVGGGSYQWGPKIIQDAALHRLQDFTANRAGSGRAMCTALTVLPRRKVL